MIHTISIFHRNTSIRSYLLAIFPHSRAHSFLRPVTISWTKLSRMACIWHFTSIRIHFSWTHHVTWCTIHWTMIHTISNFHRNACIRSYLLTILPLSWALFISHFTMNWTKFAIVTSIWHFTSHRIHFSWTHHVTWCTLYWTMIHTISNFHWHACIRSYLLPFFPHSWAGLFLCPITINWTKLSCMTKICHFASIWAHFSWTHHVILCTFCWTIIHAITNFVRNAKICCYLLIRFRIPFTRAHLFLFPITFDWNFLG